MTLERFTRNPEEAHAAPPATEPEPTLAPLEEPDEHIDGDGMGYPFAPEPWP